MLQKLGIFIVAFTLPIIIIDYYIQNIASPVEPFFENDSAITIPKKEGKISPKRTEQKKVKKDTSNSILPSSSEQFGCQIKTSTIFFQDYNSKKFSIEFEICDSLIELSTQNRITLNAKNPYQKLVEFDAPLLKNVVKEYRKQISLNKLSYKHGAEYVVSSIQNIPYTLVHSFSHENAEKISTYTDIGIPRRTAKNITGLIKKEHLKRKKIIPMDQIGGCLEKIIPYGVVSPIEMFFKQMGDCDSRATALYLILKKLGYDVLELGSEIEGHALLAINIPNPDGNIFYKYRGKKYFIWETTFFHPKQSRIGVHKEGLKYMKNWHLWEVTLN